MHLTIQPPSDYVLARDACSYGYFLLEPHRWCPKTGIFTTSLDFGGGAVTASIRQPGTEAGRRLSVVLDREVSPSGRDELKARLARVLRLDEGAEIISEFHSVDPRFRASGRGRLMRSSSLLEDVLKTVTSCNVAWPSTITMNARLCSEYGARTASGLHAFPRADRLARLRPASLRTRARVGYRDARIIALAKMFVREEIDPAWFENPATSDEDLHDALIELPGIGPYAAANIMQLLGRYHRLPLDSESVRHGRDVLGFRGTPTQIMNRVQRHFEPMGRHRFRSYWFELWGFYERKRGPSWTWERETTGKTFTASRLRDADFADEIPPADAPLRRVKNKGA